MMKNESYLLPGSEMLSEKFNDMASYYSDFHKEVFGYRPHNKLIALGGGCACDYPNASALLDAFMTLRNMCADLDARSKEVFAERELETQRAIESFENEISINLDTGATNREVALAWMCDAYEVVNQPGQNGWGYLEYKLSIPYGYIEKSMIKEAA